MQHVLTDTISLIYVGHKLIGAGHCDRYTRNLYFKAWKWNLVCFLLLFVITLTIFPPLYMNVFIYNVKKNRFQDFPLVLSPSLCDSVSVQPYVA